MIGPVGNGSRGVFKAHRAHPVAHDSYLVTLWDNNNGNPTIIASATIPARTAAPLLDGYRWVALPSTVQLNYASHYVIAAQTDGVDL